MLEAAVYSLRTCCPPFVPDGSRDELGRLLRGLLRLPDARELRKLNSVFEGSTPVSASFCRVLHCLAVL